jgi:DNA-binding NtrC family response regulator
MLRHVNETWTSLLGDLDRATAGLGAGARTHLNRLREQVEQDARQLSQVEAQVSRYRELLDRTTRMAVSRGVAPLAEELLDGMIAVVGAARGFVGLVHSDGTWRALAGRAMNKSTILDPASQVSHTLIARALREQGPIVTDDARHESWAPAASIQRLELRSVACVPIHDVGGVVGFVYLDNPSARALFDRPALAAVQAWVPVVAVLLRRAIRDTADVEVPLPGIITRSKPLIAKLSELARLAPYEVSIMLTGETGTGKSMIARRVHEHSNRKSGPFIHVNCGAIPAPLVESQLFGAVPGAFTGALSMIGSFEAASGGTVFLDELDHMPLEAQVKLLVALQERTFTRLGSTKAIPMDVRLISAVSTPPEQAIRAGRLREDLYFRLSVIVVTLPPLRDRLDDIAHLAAHILEGTRDRFHLPPLHLSPTAMDELFHHDWPGNVRELENVLDRAALLSENGDIQTVGLRHLLTDPSSRGHRAPPPPGPWPKPARRTRRARVSEPEFRDAWAQAQGDVDTCAERLGVHSRTVYRLLDKYKAH